MEMIFTEDVSLRYLQEIWVMDQRYDDYKNDISIPKKYRDMMIRVSDIKCKNYNKFCRGKRDTVTMETCKQQVSIYN